MVFFFEKDSIELQLETRLDPVTRVYTVVRRRSDGVTFSEEVIGEEPCRQVLKSIESELVEAGWRQSRPPTIEM